MHPSRWKVAVLQTVIALPEDHGLTLPPQDFPLKGLNRGSRTNWRRTTLAETRVRLARAELLRRVLKVLSCGLWRR